MDPLPDEKVKLADGQVGRHQVFLFVQLANTRLGGLFDDHLKNKKRCCERRREPTRHGNDKGRSGATSTLARDGPTTAGVHHKRNFHRGRWRPSIHGLWTGNGNSEQLLDEHLPGPCRDTSFGFSGPRFSSSRTRCPLCTGTSSCTAARVYVRRQNRTSGGNATINTRLKTNEHHNNGQQHSNNDNNNIRSSSSSSSSSGQSAGFVVFVGRQLIVGRTNRGGRDPDGPPMPFVRGPWAPAPLPRRTTVVPEPEPPADVPVDPAGAG